MADSRFAWGAGDLNVYGSEEEYRLAKLNEEISRVETTLRAAGVDPDDPEATLGDLDTDD